ncbi:MAG: lysoplasmalogenase [Chitinophagaceae bacterium]
MKEKKAWILLYAAALLGDLTGIVAGVDALHVFCKPLLMLFLVWGLVANRKAIAATPWLFIIGGLLFSWAGDLFLLFEHKNPNFFIGGLASFLLAHICYIIYYFKCGAFVSVAIKKYPWWLMAAGAYSVSLVLLLFPKLGALLGPVIAYAAVLTMMLIGSIAAIPALSKKTSRLFIAGAACFVVSDSALAINKFYKVFPMAGVLIMITYGVAQYLITSGAISNVLKSTPVNPL